MAKTGLARVGLFLAAMGNHQGPEVDAPQCVVDGEAGCKRTAIEGTVGSHRRFHRTVTAPHPEVGSRTRSRNGAPGPEMCTFGVLGLCEAPAAPKPPRQ